jgi:cytochrome c oxidase cbb3-type subunit III
VRRVPGVPFAAWAMTLGLVLAACDSFPGRPNVANREVLPSQVMAFDVLYRRNCAGCHGTDGRLGAARPLNDPIYIALVPAERLRAIIADGVPGTSMPAFAASAGGSLTNAQVDALAKGMTAAWGRPDAVKNVTLPPYQAEVKSSETDSASGAGVYTAACARCHGPDGKGGPKAGSIVDAAFLSLVSDQSLRTTVITGRPDLGKPDWRNDIPGQPLTPEQISDVVAWLAGQRRPVPGRPADTSEPGPNAPRSKKEG